MSFVPGPLADRAGIETDEVDHGPRASVQMGRYECAGRVYGKLMIALLVGRLLEEVESVSPWGYR